MIATGEIEVIVDGQPIHRLGPGAGVGEIALLRRGPRTATVVAITDVTGYSVDAATFLAAVAGPAAAAMTERMVQANLQRSAEVVAAPTVLAPTRRSTAASRQAVRIGTTCRLGDCADAMAACTIGRNGEVAGATGEFPRHGVPMSGRPTRAGSQWRDRPRPAGGTRG